MENNEAIFPNGFIVKRPNEKAPDFIKLNFSIKVDEFVPFLKENQNNGWCNLDLKLSKQGKLYTQLNTYTAKKIAEQSEEDKSSEAQDEFNKATADWDSF